MKKSPANETQAHDAGCSQPAPVGGSRAAARVPRGDNPVTPVRVGVLGCYAKDFQRLRPPPGVTIELIERDRAALGIPKGLDYVLLFTRFVSHRHWQQLRSSGVPIISEHHSFALGNEALQKLVGGVDMQPCRTNLPIREEPMDSTPFTRRPLHEAKALRRAYGDEKYGTALRTGVSWPVEAYIECVDIDNYLDFAYAASEIDEGMFWEMHAHLGALMHLLKGAARE